MPVNIKIGILGGDKRQLVVADCLSKRYECAMWGFASLWGTADEKYMQNTIRCADWESAVKCAEAVILPLPISRDGVRLSCPLASSVGEESCVRLTEICEKMSVGSVLLGGMIPPSLKRFAAEHGIKTFDYYDSEELQIKNAVPTAEGAISACIENIPYTVSGMRTAVFGYGRIGRTLAMRLRALGAEVYAVARSRRDLSWAKCDGCIPTTIDEYKAFPVACEAVFNTIPSLIFDPLLIDKLPPDTVIFELSTGCVGVDMQYAREHGIKVIPLPSLPGKTSPISAGEIICSVVRAYVDERFLPEVTGGGDI